MKAMTKKKDIFKKFQDEEDGQENIAGYLAMKFKSKYPELGTLNYVLTSSESYTQHMSLGGLTKPENHFLRFCKFLNRVFLSIHRISFAFTKRVLKRTFEMIEERTGGDIFNKFPKEIAREYVKQRIYLRIKNLNEKLKEKIHTERIQRKRRHCESHVSAKLRKLMN